MIKTLGLILKKQSIGETDRIITILSPSLGKKRVVARAVRKPLSKLSGHLDTFMISQLILTDENDLPKVTSAVLVESFESLRASLPLVEQAYAISKITERVILEDVPQQTMFRITVDALSRIDEGVAWPNVWLRYLGEVTKQLGLQLGDFTCRICGKKITDSAYWDQLERGFTCASCPSKIGRQLSVQAIKVLFLLSKQQYAVVQRAKLSEQVASEVEEVLLREITEWFNRPWTSYRGLGNQS
jgi:DNA repair protein RecO (recombination protein O)